jgi:hypothetical protein
MARPLFEIAKEISADWPGPTPQAKAYLKGLYYLLGMDDHAADLDASTAVRMFLLYSKIWIGPTSDRIKAELQALRKAGTTNAELLQQSSFVEIADGITHCESCDKLLTAPAKFVDGHAYWGKRLRMCMHCNYCLAAGLDEGYGALYIASPEGGWLKLHGEPIAPPAQTPADAQAPMVSIPQPTLRFRAKRFSRKVIKKAVSVVRQWVGRSA